LKSVAEAIRRPGMDDLQILAELRTALPDAKRAWLLVERLESSLDSDPRTSEYERGALARLKSSVSELIAAQRDGLNLHTSDASVAITALETSIRKRTTGPDRWPLA
jgi:hypothetical protein